VLRQGSRLPQHVHALSTRVRAVVDITDLRRCQLLVSCSIATIVACLALFLYAAAISFKRPLLSVDVSLCVCACVLALLYGCETWTLYRRSIRRLDQFHLRCLRNIARVKWQDRIPDTDVLNTCGIMGIEAFLLKAQLRWVGHIMRMPDSRIPEQIFLGQLASGKRLQCGPLLRYKDALKVNLKQCDIDPSALGDDT